MKRQPKIEVHQPDPNPQGDPNMRNFKPQWYWRLRAPNGRIVADGAEGYTRQGDATKAARRAVVLMVEARIVAPE